MPTPASKPRVKKPLDMCTAVQGGITFEGESLADLADYFEQRARIEEAQPAKAQHLRELRAAKAETWRNAEVFVRRFKIKAKVSK